MKACSFLYKLCLYLNNVATTQIFYFILTEESLNCLFPPLLQMIDESSRFLHDYISFRNFQQLLLYRKASQDHP